MEEVRLPVSIGVSADCKKIVATDDAGINLAYLDIDKFEQRKRDCLKGVV